MPDTVEKVAERLAQLEKTVAQGQHENTLRFNALETRITALDSKFDVSVDKFDVSVESLRSEIQSVREVLSGFIVEMRRTTASMRKEHAADREILRLALLDHGRRITRLESKDLAAPEPSEEA